MTNLTILEQPGFDDPGVAQFAVYAAFGRNDKLTFLSKHETRERAWEWSQQYLRHNGNPIEPEFAGLNDCLTAPHHKARTNAYCL